MTENKEVLIDIQDIQPTYIIFKRENKNYIENPLIYDKKITQYEENNIIDTFLKNNDIIIDIKEGRKFKINEKLLSIQRYIHNDLGLAYKDILDIEIVYIEKFISEDETIRISHRYPNEGRDAIDFKATILDTFIDCNFNRQNINTNNENKMYIMVMISDNERRIIGELVNRYLFIEDQETMRNQPLYYGNNDSYNRVFRPSYNNSRHRRARIYRPRRSSRVLNNSFSTFNSILNESNQLNNSINNIESFNESDNFYNIHNNVSQNNTNSSIGLSDLFTIINNQDNNYEERLRMLERERENELNEIRNTLFDRNNNLDYEIEYTIYNNPSINSSFFGPSSSGSSILNNFLPENSLFENMITLLRYVNDVSDENNNFENLMEPVRVTINENKIDTFLKELKYNKDITNDLKVKNQETCTICLSTYEKDENVSYLHNCNHLFHTTCINKWLLEFNHKCPICRLSADPLKNI